MPDQPQETPSHVRFGGILEGRCDDPQELAHVIHSYNRCAVVLGDLEIDGPRFSFTFATELIAGTALSSDSKGQLVQSLEQLVGNADPQYPIESTLHCREFHEDTVVETMFGVRDGAMAVVSRVRPIENEERRHRPPPTSYVAVESVRRLGLGRAALVLGAMLTLFVLSAWKGGYVDRVLAPQTSDLRVSLGDLEGQISATLEQKWGNYEVKLARGIDYPDTVEAARLWESEAKTLEHRALRQALTNGSNVFLRLKNSDGKVLEVVSISLRPLLSADGIVKAHIPGRLGAKRLDLGLSEGSK